MALIYKKSLHGVHRDPEIVVLNNSTTFYIGDVVESYTAGSASLCAAGESVLGVIEAFGVGDPMLPESKGGNVAGAANTSDLRTVTTAADNTTTKKYWALVNSDKSSIFSAEINGTVGTTSDSELRGARLNVDSGNSNYGKLLESSATRTITTQAQFYSFGADPEDTTRLLVRIAKSEMDSDINTEA